MPITPAQLASCGSEHGEQAAVIQYCAVSLSRRVPEAAKVFAVPNGADYGGNRQTGARMKAEGLRSGVPDLFWPYPRPPRWGGLWIELKRPQLQGTRDGGRSPSQVEWHRWLRGQGWPVVLAFGWEAAARAMILYARDGLSMADADALFLWPGCEQLPMLPEPRWWD